MTRVESKPKSLNKQQLKTGKQLGIAATICLFAIYAIFLLTDKAAKISEKQYLVKSLSKVLPESGFDNDLLATRQQLGDMIVYQACKEQKPIFQIYEIKTNKGYSGLIKLLVSIDLTQKKIEKIRPLFHQETPGLGDQIDVDKSPWLQQFEVQLSTPAAAIAVKKDKGQIDAITGATITSRAVSDAVRTAFFSKPLQQLPNLCEQKP